MLELRPIMINIVVEMSKMTMRIAVDRRTLLLLAGVVWSVAGFNVARVGILTWLNEVEKTVEVAVWMSVVYIIFYAFIFNRLYHKYTQMISAMGDANPPYAFFDRRGWLIMTFMITLGFTLRTFQLASPYFFAFFYTGLGGALFMTGVRFFGFLIGAIWQKRL